MATSGVKRIKISSIDREGNDNSSKFLDLEEIIINHPKGIDDINNIGVSGSNILGGPTSYPITNTRQNVGNFLFSTVPTTQNSNLTQTIIPDITVYATSSGQFATSFYNIGVLTTKQNQSNAQFKSPEVQWDGNWEQISFNQNQSNPSGWLTGGGAFEIKDIPPYQFKIKIYGKIARIGSSTPPTQSLYALVADYGASQGVLNVYSVFPQVNSIFPLGYLPPQSILISASNGQDQNINFEFIVTQSYSRILNKPIGPSYGPTTYTLGGSLNPTPNTIWSFYLGASTGSAGNDASELYMSRSGLFLEITPYPTSSTAPTIDIMNTSLVSYSATKLYAGNIFSHAGVNWIVTIPELITGIASASLTVGNIDTWVKAGYISAYNITNFPSNSFYNSNSTYKGFRAASLLTTSSYIPLVDTDENYATSEFNPLINNVDISPQSSFYYDLDYSNGMSTPVNLPQVNQGSAEKARVNDSNYSRESWNNIRYRGSRVTSPGINKTS